MFIRCLYTISVWKGVMDVDMEGEIHDRYIGKIHQGKKKHNNNRSAAIIITSLLWYIYQKSLHQYVSKIIALFF